MMSAEPTQCLWGEVPWEYTVAYVDKHTGRHSPERTRGDGRSLEVALAHLKERQQGNPLWSDSVVIRRRRSEWERIDGDAFNLDGVQQPHSDGS